MGKILPLYEDLIRFYPTDKDYEKVRREIGGEAAFEKKCGKWREYQTDYETPVSKAFIK